MSEGLPSPTTPIASTEPVAQPAATPVATNRHLAGFARGRSRGHQPLFEILLLKRRRGYQVETATRHRDRAADQRLAEQQAFDVLVSAT